MSADKQSGTSSRRANGVTSDLRVSCELTDAAKQVSLTAVNSETLKISSRDASQNDSSSHPGLLDLARLLGRHAARSDLRRTRRGAIPLLAMGDQIMMATAVIVAAWCWFMVTALQ